jgi:hypothetical protein
MVQAAGPSPPRRPNGRVAVAGFLDTVTAALAAIIGA